MNRNVRRYEGYRGYKGFKAVTDFAVFKVPDLGASKNVQKMTPPFFLHCLEFQIPRELFLPIRFNPGPVHIALSRPGVVRL